MITSQSCDVGSLKALQHANLLGRELTPRSAIIQEKTESAA